MHAEINAIMKLPKNINYRQIKLLIVREGLKLSKPCEKCHVVLTSLGINKIYYSDNGKIHKLIL
ncbi:MAG: hypothetical protein ACW98X_11095 [Promethearchaeota archaeon]